MCHPLLLPLLQQQLHMRRETQQRQQAGVTLREVGLFAALLAWNCAMRLGRNTLAKTDRHRRVQSHQRRQASLLTCRNRAASIRMCSALMHSCCCSCCCTSSSGCSCCCCMLATPHSVLAMSCPVERSRVCGLSVSTTRRHSSSTTMWQHEQT